MRKIIIVIAMLCSLVGCNNNKTLLTKDTANISKSMIKYFETDYIELAQGENFDAKLVNFYKAGDDTFVYRFIVACKYDEKTTIKKVRLESNIVNSSLFDEFNEMGDQSSFGYIRYKKLEEIKSLCLDVFVKNRGINYKKVFSEEEFEQVCSNINLVITSNHKKELLSFLDLKYLELPDSSDDEFINDMINGNYHLRIWEYH